MLHVRTRSVCIRVSDAELRTLREACERKGLRSVSELAREAMHRIVDARQSAPLARHDMQFWLKELDCRLTNLQTEVRRLQAVFANQANP